ncbi:MAG TPA: protocatechuate 3,4-dioxygenase [Burkholderiales bacterium]|nr:protocatechuate 3,4-dioxygenase [Burkholderiales bacterium]
MRRGQARIATPSLGDSVGLRTARVARRELLAAALAGTALAGLPWRAGAQGAARIPTPRQTEGPFYPDRLPADDDNDLVAVKGQNGIARGEILLLAGTVTDLAGKPLPGARVEIWQCDAGGRYHHSRDSSSSPPDPNFQGWGQFVTAADGEYRFRTIRPVPYPGRTPHIHFKVSGKAIPVLVTQMYVEGEPGNARDGVFASLDPRERAAVTVRLDKSPDGRALTTRFEVVLRA